MAIVGTFKIEKDPFYQQGRREERAKARTEKKEMALNTARNFKNMGLSIEDIAKGTGLSIEEIKAL
jgi:predicted transposase/invertase (TIGR01784 family)